MQAKWTLGVSLSCLALSIALSVIAWSGRRIGKDGLPPTRSEVGARQAPYRSYMRNPESLSGRRGRQACAVDAGWSVETEREADICVRVIDHDGKPMPSIKVVARRVGWVLPEAAVVDLGGVSVGVSNRDGTVRFTLQAGPYRFYAVGPKGNHAAIARTIGRREGLSEEVDLEVMSPTIRTVVPGGPGANRADWLVVVGGDPVAAAWIWSGGSAVEVEEAGEPSTLLFVDCDGVIRGHGQLLGGGDVGLVEISCGVEEALPCPRLGAGWTHAVLATGEERARCLVVTDGVTKAIAGLNLRVIALPDPAARASGEVRLGRVDGSSLRLVEVAATMVDRQGAQRPWRNADVLVLSRFPTDDGEENVTLSRALTDDEGRCRVLVPCEGSYDVLAGSRLGDIRSWSAAEDVLHVTGRARGPAWQTGVAGGVVSAVVEGVGVVRRAADQRGYWVPAFARDESFYLTDWPWREYGDPESLECADVGETGGVLDVRAIWPKPGEARLVVFEQTAGRVGVMKAGTPLEALYRGAVPLGPDGLRLPLLEKSDWLLGFLADHSDAPAISRFILKGGASAQLVICGVPRGGLDFGTFPRGTHVSLSRCLPRPSPLTDLAVSERVSAVRLPRGKYSMRADLAGECLHFGAVTIDGEEMVKPGCKAVPSMRVKLRALMGPELSMLGVPIRIRALAAGQEDCCYYVSTGGNGVTEITLPLGDYRAECEFRGARGMTDFGSTSSGLVVDVRLKH